MFGIGHTPPWVGLVGSALALRVEWKADFELPYEADGKTYLEYLKISSQLNRTY